MTANNGKPRGGAFQGLEAGKFGTVLADPPWQFVNRTGKVAPEHRRSPATRR